MFRAQRVGMKIHLTAIAGQFLCEVALDDRSAELVQNELDASEETRLHHLFGRRRMREVFSNLLQVKKMGTTC
jgi:SAM-dependent MidA family methyltransferase